MENKNTTNSADMRSFYKKKLAVRKALSEGGRLKHDKINKFDGYSYLSEAAYKEVFTSLFTENGLDLEVTLLEIQDVTGTEKQSFGRRVLLQFTLTDTDTFFQQISTFYGEGFDKGDKAIYKAYTGALKYYLALNFLVATGDEPERDDREPERNAAPTSYSDRKAGKSSTYNRKEPATQPKPAMQTQSASATASAPSPYVKPELVEMYVKRLLTLGATDEDIYALFGRKIDPKKTTQAELSKMADYGKLLSETAEQAERDKLADMVDEALG